MQANELRIGNYYNEFGIPKQATPNLILNLCQIEITGKIPIDFSFISLTEEWLIKFGCYKLGSIFTTPEINGHRMYIRTDDSGNFYNLINEFTVIKLPFVHTFQNYVFALTGQELIIKEA